jgi:hypothetical protein
MSAISSALPITKPSKQNVSQSTSTKGDYLLFGPSNANTPINIVDNITAICNQEIKVLSLAKKL